MELSDAKIYVESLKAYNEGKSVGEWLDLSDYSSGEEVMEAISEFLKKVSKKTKSLHEEYAIHDYENFPKRFYSESMGESDFDEIYEFFQVVEDSDIPADVVDEYVTDGNDLDNVSDNYQGSYKDREDFAYQTVEELGLASFSYPQNYIYMSDTDKRITAGEEADSIVEGMDDDELISEADMEGDKSELEEKISELETEIEELESEDEVDSSKVTEKEKEKSELESELEGLVDKAKEKVQSDKADEIEGKLDDPYDYFVNEQGMYSAEDFFKANFVSIDYNKIADDLGQDYNIIEGEDGSIYVFRNYARGGELKPKNNRSDFKNYYANHHAIITGGSYFNGSPIMAKGGVAIKYPTERLNVVEQSEGERQLELFIDNDGDLYRQRVVPIHTNLVTKIAQGKFDINLAPKIYFYLIDDGQKKFMKEVEDYKDYGVPLTKAQKENLAKEYVNRFLQEASYGNYENYLPAKYKMAKGGKTESRVDFWISMFTPRDDEWREATLKRLIDKGVSSFETADDWQAKIDALHYLIDNKIQQEDEMAKGGKIKPIDFDLPEDYEFVGDVANELRKSKIDANARFFDKYQGAYILACGEKFWVKDSFSTGEKSEEPRKYRKAILLDLEGEYSANQSDYFQLPKNHVFEGNTLVLTKQDGEKIRISDPKVSDLPKSDEVDSLTFSYKKGTTTEHILFAPESDYEESEYEVLINEDGNIDASDLIQFCKAKSKTV